MVALPTAPNASRDHGSNYIIVPYPTQDETEACFGIYYIYPANRTFVQWNYTFCSPSITSPAITWDADWELHQIDLGDEEEGGGEKEKEEMKMYEEGFGGFGKVLP